jgi:hypothetical protein
MMQGKASNYAQVKTVDQHAQSSFGGQDGYPKRKAKEKSKKKTTEMQEKMTR